MAGVNPALLAHLGAATAAAATPAHHAPPPPGGKGGGDAGAAGAGTGGDDEPKSSHDACAELASMLKSASQMADDLQSQIELEDDVDPKVEQSVTQAAKLLSQASDLIDKVEQGLGDKAKEGDEAGGGPGDYDGDE